MIIALISKDLRVIARDRIFQVTISGFLLVYLAASMVFLSSFLSAGNYPFAEMSSLFFTRLAILQGVLLAAFIPWIILRMHEQDLGDPGAMSALVLASPFQVILSKLAASALCVINLSVLSLPFLCAARILGAATFRQILWVLADTFLFLMVLTVIVFHLRFRFRSWLSCWILSYAAFVLTCIAWINIWALVGREYCSVLCLLVLVFLAALLFPHGNKVLLYERN